MDSNGMGELVAFFGKFQFQRLFLLALGFGLLTYLVRTLHRGAAHLSQKFPKKRLLVLQLETTVIFLLYIFGGTMLVYGVLHPAKELLIALGGGVAVAVGLSLKDLVASLFAGLILLFDRPFQVGDRVQFGDIYGEIKTIGLRAVRLVTLDDNLVTIPNARFITEMVSSGNAGALDMMIVIPFHLALDADIQQARDILYEIVVTSRFVYLKKPVTIVACEVITPAGLALQLSAKAYVLDVRYEKAFQTDIVMRATQAFSLGRIARPVLKIRGHSQPHEPKTMGESNPPPG
jgi:small-conductance mechanosensitive channel